jgi:hypothetical protein
MRDVELLPRDYSSCALLVLLNFESTVLQIKDIRFLSEDSGQEPHDGPAEEAAVRCGVATVEK